MAFLSAAADISQKHDIGPVKSYFGLPDYWRVAPANQVQIGEHTLVQFI